MVSNTGLHGRDNENLKDSSINPTDKGNESLLCIELEERKLALKECQVKLKKVEEKQKQLN